jgi:hypothetical protein
LNWRKIKTVLILLLAAVNIYLLVVLISQYQVGSTVGGPEMKAALKLLEKDGIRVGEDVLSGKKPYYRVWQSDYDSDRRAQLLARIFGAEAAAEAGMHLTGEGLELSLAGIGVVRFTDSSPFLLKFTADGCTYAGEYDELLSSAEKLPDGIRRCGWLRRKDLGKKLEQFLSGSVPGAEPGAPIPAKIADIDVDSAIYLSSERLYIARFTQLAEGCAIEGSGGIFAVRAELVLYTDASVIWLSNPEYYTAALLDEINILFRERDHILAQSPADDRDKASEILVTGIEPVYCVNWNADLSDFYLIPSWNISYSDGSKRTRNAVNGSLVGG